MRNPGQSRTICKKYSDYPELFLIGKILKIITHFCQQISTAGSFSSAAPDHCMVLYYFFEMLQEKLTAIIQFLVL